MDYEEAWRRLAVELGFRFVKEIRPYIELPSMHRLAAQAVKKGDMGRAEALLSGPLRGLLSRLYIGSATGYYRNFEFALFRTNISESAAGTAPCYVNVVMMLKTNLGLGLEIKSADFRSRIAGKFLPGRRVRIPRTLGGIVSVKAEDVGRAQTLFDNQSPTQSLVKLFKHFPKVIVNDRDIRYDERGHIVEKGKALKIMDLMADVGEAVDFR